MKKITFSNQCILYLKFWHEPINIFYGTSYESRLPEKTPSPLPHNFYGATERNNPQRIASEFEVIGGLSYILRTAETKKLVFCSDSSLSFYMPSFLFASTTLSILVNALCALYHQRTVRGTITIRGAIMFYGQPFAGNINSELNADQYNAMW